ncbi:MAG TPA: hypothetical protein VFF00_02060 [Candidatus Elarobacter sp.]|nr:hypothetical protein [Dongiaceae bacterium]HZW52785.1 hypothetical protein [Candidatus Elarobacter sp.]
MNGDEESGRATDDAEPERASDDAEPGVSKEQITLPDGRYLIYYTFGDDEA